MKIILRSVLCGLLVLISSDAYPQTSKYFKNDTAKVNYFNRIARQRINLSDFTKANEMADSALRLAKKINFWFGEANAISNQGIILCLQGKYTEAMKKQEAALQIRIEKKSLPGIAGSYINIGVIHDYKGNFPEAERYYGEALKTFQENGTPRTATVAFNTVAGLYIKHHNQPAALRDFVDGLNKKPGEKDSLADSYNEMGLKNLGLRRLTEAREFFKSGLERSMESKNTQGMSESYLGLAKTDSAQGDYESAFEFYKLYAAYKDSFEKDQMSDKLVQDKMQYEINQQKALQLAEQAKAEALLQKQQMRTYALFASFVLLVIVAILLYNRYRLKKKALQQLKDTQEQLIRQQKLASLGQLTAGIAHEIKNPLNFVNNFSESSEEILEELKTTTDEQERNTLISELKQNLQKISHHGRRADSIVRNMLEHSRTGSGEKQPTDLNELASEFFDISFHGMRANHPDFNCKLEKKLSVNLPSSNIVAQDISRVLLNLFNNAFYTVYEKSKSAANGYQPTVSLSTELVADSVIIAVKDNGNGIPDNIRDKIFEPFFTTKPTGIGTGLGLSLSYDIVNAHGGILEVDSVAGSGTTFRITLPQ